MIIWTVCSDQQVCRGVNVCRTVIYMTALQHSRTHEQTLTEWVGAHLLVYHVRQQSDEKKSFLLNIRQQIKVIRDISALTSKPQPTHTARPDSLGSCSFTPTPSLSLFLSLTHLGPVTKPSPNSLREKKVFWVCCCLFCLAALFARQTVSALILRCTVRAFHFRDVLALGFGLI